MTKEEVAEMERIRKKNGGLLLAEKVFEAARPKDHVFHPRFEWDKEKAWQAHNVEIANRLIRTFESVFTLRPPQPPFTVTHEKYAPAPGVKKGYFLTDAMLDGPECKAFLLQEHERAHFAAERYMNFLRRAGREQVRAALEKAWQDARAQLEATPEVEAGD